MDNDINREINIEQVEFGIDIDNIEYSIEINPRDTFAIELNEQGPQGATGPIGPQGPQGEVGPQGPQGEIGPANTLSIGTVEKGEEAEATITGESPNQVLNLVLPKGDKGDKGIQGEIGPVGPRGEQGPQGLKGDRGDRGIQGEQGPIGLTGPAGPQGPQGEVGAQGPKGDTGAQGVKGDTGVSVTGVTLQSTLGLEKTYRMGFSDGNHFDYVVKDGASGATEWGGISGILSNQTDLKDALNSKLDLTGGTVTGNITVKDEDSGDINIGYGEINIDTGSNKIQFLGADILAEYGSGSFFEVNSEGLHFRHNDADYFLDSGGMYFVLGDKEISCQVDDILHIPTPEADYSSISVDAAITAKWLKDNAMPLKQDVITDLETIRTNAQTGANLAPQVEVNTQRIEDLTTSRIPDVIYHGTPKITGGQVSNFSTTNYLQFPFTDISRGLPFDIYFSFTTDDDVTTQQNVIDSKFGIALAIQNGKGIMALSSNGTSWDIGSVTGTNTLLPNTTYYVKYSWTGSEYNASLSTNETEYIPDMVLPSNLSPYKTTIYIGGCNQSDISHTPHPFKGIINFTKSKVIVNGVVAWEGMADVGISSRANVSLNNLDDVGEARFTDLQSAINLKADNSSVVHRTGDETISGKKTFNSNIGLTSGKQIIDTTTNKTVFGRGTSSQTFFVGAPEYSMTFRGASERPIYTTPTTSKYLALKDDVDGKQDALVSGTNIKTINNESILGSGNFDVSSIEPLTQEEYDRRKEAGELEEGKYYSTPSDVSLEILEVLYPVGSFFFGTMSVCPLATLGIGTWQLVGTSIISDVASIAPVVGNGMAVGLTNGTTNYGLSVNNNSSSPYLYGSTDSYGNNVGNTKSGSANTINLVYGITTDPTKSGIEANIASTKIPVNIFRRIA